MVNVEGKGVDHKKAQKTQKKGVQRRGHPKLINHEIQGIREQDLNFSHEGHGGSRGGH
jgi:hypothetical protein